MQHCPGRTILLKEKTSFENGFLSWPLDILFGELRRRRGAGENISLDQYFYNLEFLPEDLGRIRVRILAYYAEHLPRLVEELAMHRERAEKPHS